MSGPEISDVLPSKFALRKAAKLKEIEEAKKSGFPTPEELESYRADMDAKYRRAALFSMPMFVAFGIVLMEVLLDIRIADAGAVLLGLVVGMLIAFWPVRQHNKAKIKYDRAQKLSNLQVMEAIFKEAS